MKHLTFSRIVVPAKKKHILKSFLSVTLLSAVCGLHAADHYSLKLTLDRTDGVYRNNDTIIVSTDFRINNKPEQVPLEVKIFQVNNTCQTVKIPAGQKTFSETIKGNTLRFTVSALGADGKPLMNEIQGRKVPVTAAIGAIAEPEKCTPFFQEPSDFQEFWDKALAELAKVPVKAERKQCNLSPKNKGKFNCWDVKVDCAGGKPVSGYLIIPANAPAKSLPAVVTFQSAGVASSWKTTVPGAISFSINAHGIENGHPRPFYLNLYKTDYANYWWKNATDKNTYYFRSMFLRVKRALDYVKTIPEYDGRTLIVIGGSQGGAQALVAAALDPDVKIVSAMVPAMCDLGGIIGGRLSGWPQLIRMKNGRVLNESVSKTLMYYDMSFFAKRIKADVYFTVGLIDTTCCPTSVFAAYNNIPGKKNIQIMPEGGHLYNLKSKAFHKRLKELTGAK